MTYISGNIPPTANPGLDLYNAISASLSAAGLTLVDTVVISTRTHKVWKSPAASNLYGDWYVDIVYPTTGAGPLVMIPYEDYNAASDLGIRGPLSGVGTNTFAPETTYYSRYGATGQTLESALWMPTGSTTTGFGFTTGTGGFGYQISITPNRIVGQTSLMTAELVYCGFFEPTPEYAAANAGFVFPLVVLNPTNSNKVGGIGYTRFPKITASQEMRRQYQAGILSVLVAYPTPTLNTGSTAAQGSYILNRVPLSTEYTYWSSGLAMATYGWLRDVGLAIMDSSVARGDTVTIGTDTWITTSVTAGTPNGGLAFKAV